MNALPTTDAVRIRPRQPDVHTLGGPGQGCTLTMNGQTYDPDEGLPVRSGQRVRLQTSNTTTMPHPIHLHGHTFQAVRSPGQRRLWA